MRPCRYATGPRCAEVPCPGESDIAHCLSARVADPGNARIVAYVGDPPNPGPAPTAGPAAGALDPAARDRVLTCPHRGPEGGLVLLEEETTCCGGGDERTACAIGKGLRPGRVTLRECLACQSRA